MAELSALQSVPGGNIGSGNAQVFNPMQGVQILANARQRQDQIDWHNKQEALRKAQLEAAARKQAEDDEVVAKYDVAQGNFLARPVQEIINARIAQNKQNWANANKAQKMQMVADTDLLAKEANNFIARHDQGIKDVYSRLGSDYLIPATEVTKLADTAVKNNPNDFYKRDFVPELERTITTNPAYFNFGNVGKRLESIAGTLSNQTINASGTGTSKKYSQFLTGKKDRTTGLPIIDKDVAMALIEKDPVAVDMKNKLVAQKLPELQNQFPNMKPDELLDVANGEVINKMFKGRGIYDVTQDNQSTLAKAAAGARGVKLADIEEVQTPININYNVKYNDGTSTTLPINLGQGTSVRLKQPAEIGSNRKAYILGGDVSNLGDLVTKQPDGSYLLNFGFKTREYQKPKEVLQLTQDTKFLLKDGSVKTREKGSLISPIEAANLRKAGMERNFKKVKGGYRISPGTLEVDEETEKKVGPIFQGLDLFFPGGNGELPELENVNPRKKPVVVTEDVDLGLE